MNLGIKDKTAPELRVPFWIGPHGEERDPLQLTELGRGYKLIYCFQAWCPGCHSQGFPTLQKLVDAFADKEFGFAVVQTVFEGEAQNTPDKLREMQERYSLAVPFGHDPAAQGRHPSVMEDYRTGGTPWFILIGPDNKVIFNDFGLDADKLIQLGLEEHQ